jgi:hypothetical protein
MICVPRRAGEGGKASRTLNQTNPFPNRSVISKSPRSTACMRSNDNHTRETSRSSSSLRISHWFGWTAKFIWLGIGRLRHPRGVKSQSAVLLTGGIWNYKGVIILIACSMRFYSPILMFHPVCVVVVWDWFSSPSRAPTPHATPRTARSCHIVCSVKSTCRKWFLWSRYTGVQRITCGGNSIRFCPPVGTWGRGLGVSCLGGVEANHSLESTAKASASFRYLDCHRVGSKQPWRQGASSWKLRFLSEQVFGGPDLTIKAIPIPHETQAFIGK